jgi:NDP-sugar pyrophosphorylase family protein
MKSLQPAADESRPPVFGAGVTIVDSVVWDAVVLGDGSSLRRCIVTDGVHVRPGADFENAILMADREQGMVAVPFDPEA